MVADLLVLLSSFSSIREVKTFTSSEKWGGAGAGIHDDLGSGSPNPSPAFVHKVPTAVDTRDLSALEALGRLGLRLRDTSTNLGNQVWHHF